MAEGSKEETGYQGGGGICEQPAILAWAKRLGTKVLGIIYNADSVPWCGVFVAYCLQEDDIEPASIAVRATSWSTWGQALRPERLAPGAVLTFERPGGGHVGFYVGEDAEAYHILGGNQGNAVTIARIAKQRCIARRWPTGRPVIGKPVQLGSSKPISVNEA
ncbi:TIGR02594 family protein [Sphingomonas sp. PB2P12]|uniref:TIGR02594 family protein n=1 Tax=Sphingomonas sandaracina TaxID=3096157 RepID=UPI002FC91202